MKEETAQKHCENHLTICCASTWSEESRLCYKCDKCGSDVTMEIIFLYQALTT